MRTMSAYPPKPMNKSACILPVPPLTMKAVPLNKVWVASETSRELDWWTEMSTDESCRVYLRRFVRYLHWTGIASWLGQDTVAQVRHLERVCTGTQQPTDTMTEIVHRLRRIEDELHATQNRVPELRATHHPGPA